MSTITYPRGNNYQMYTVTNSGRNAFQENTVREIVASPEFDFACVGIERGPGSKYTGPFNFLWYDKEGRLHLTRIGRAKILREIVNPAKK